MFRYGEDEYIAAWVADKIPHSREFGPNVSIGYESQGKLIAGFVFNNYYEEFELIELSMAAISPMWAKKDVIAEVLQYPFEQLGIYKLYTATMHDNEKALKVNSHIGFKKEATLAHHFGPKKHCVIMRMLRPDYDRLWR
tara:strand:- start:3952 stop:4368 length:417 start_codon:yes stop_codon:yes gene_type:complete